MAKRRAVNKRASVWCFPFVVRGDQPPLQWPRNVKFVRSQLGWCRITVHQTDDARRAWRYEGYWSVARDDTPPGKGK